MEWDDGRTTDAHGVAVSWNCEAVQVMFTGLDGRRRREWLPVEAVRQRNDPRRFQGRRPDSPALNSECAQATVTATSRTA